MSVPHIHTYTIDKGSVFLHNMSLSCHIADQLKMDLNVFTVRTSMEREREREGFALIQSSVPY